MHHLTALVFTALGLTWAVPGSAGVFICAMNLANRAPLAPSSAATFQSALRIPTKPGQKSLELWRVATVGPNDEILLRRDQQTFVLLSFPRQNPVYVIEDLSRVNGLQPYAEEVSAVLIANGEAFLIGPDTLVRGATGFGSAPPAQPNQLVFLAYPHAADRFEAPRRECAACGNPSEFVLDRQHYCRACKAKVYNGLLGPLVPALLGPPARPDLATNRAEHSGD